MKLRLASIFFAAVLLVFLFENCQSNTQKFSPPNISNQVQSGGNGDGYGGKLTFYVGMSDVQLRPAVGGVLIPPASTSSVYSVTPNLPAGLIVNSTTGVISGTPAQVTTDYQSYLLVEKNGMTEISSIPFYLGVSSTYVVSAAVDGLGQPDANVNDLACADANGICSLSAALQQANASSMKIRIQLPAKTYLLNNLAVFTNVELLGQGIGLTTFSGDDKNRVLKMTAENITLKNLTITHGKNLDSDFGAGVQYNNGKGTLELVNVEISYNVAATTLSSGGGGIYFAGNQFIMKNSHVHHNSALAAGGQAPGGGAIYLHSGFNTIKNSIIDDNLSNSFGAGIFSNLSYNLILENVTLVRNASIQKGAAIYAGWGGPITITQSAIVNNTSSSQDGGALYWIPVSLGSLNIENSTFSGNRATNGAALSIDIGCSTTGNKITLRNTTFAENIASAVGGGGAIYLTPGGDCHISLINSIVATNGTKSCNVESVAKTPIVATGFNIQSDTSCGTDSSTLTTANPLLSPLTYSSGSYIYTLLNGSPAIDKADNALCPAVDQMGVARPQGLGCDIGAIESK